MDYRFRKLVLKGGKEQLLIDFTPKSDILSSFIESEVASFGKEVLESINAAKQTEQPVEFSGNSALAIIDKEYTRVESQMDDAFCILRTDEFAQIVSAFLEEKKVRLLI